MPLQPLHTWLARERLVTDGDLRAAVARQAVYGGTLDTALLEAGALTETALWARLAAVSGLPVPAPALCDGTGPHVEPALPAERLRALGAVPVAVDDTAAAMSTTASAAARATVKILCHESAPVAAIRAEAMACGFEARLYVVPEVRLLAMRQRVYGERMPSRYATLLARLLGPTRARTDFLPAPDPSKRRATPPPPPPRRSPIETEIEAVIEAVGELPEAVAGAAPTTLMPDPPSGPVHLALLSSLVPTQPPPGLPEAGALEQSGDAVVIEAVPELVTGGEFSVAATEALCRRARDATDKGRLLAARALRQRLAHPAVVQLLESLRADAAKDDESDAEVAVAAIETLAEARDPAALPVLIERMGRPPAAVAAAAHTALVALCATDQGSARRRWASWAKVHAAQPRVEWLLAGLAHKQPAIRMAAAEELRHLAGDSFGYLFDLPKRAREQARERFVAWWQAAAATHPSAK